MKQLFVFSFIFCFSLTVYGQNKNYLWIQDGNGNPLSEVVVSSDILSYFEVSDEFGKVLLPDLTQNQHILFTFSHLGYRTVQYSFEKIKKVNFVVRLNGTSHELEEVEVIGRRNEQEGDVVAQVVTIGLKESNLITAQTAADVLEQSGEIFVQKSQMGGGSPVVRGFEANRVLLVIDGVRMNNAIYRSGHLQNSISVDKESLAGMEILFGPGALTYGSDALGGVIHFRTQNPMLMLGDTLPRIQSTIGSKFGTSNSEKSVFVRMNYGQKKWAVLSSISFSDFGDLRSGEKGIKGYAPILRKQYVKLINGRDSIVENTDPFLQIHSGFKQYNISQKWKFRWSNRWDLLANIQYASTSNIPRYDQLTVRKNGQLKFAEWYYGPQTRMLTSLQFRWSDPVKLFDKALFIVARQFIEEDRYSRKLFQQLKQISLVDVNVWSMTIDFEKKLGNRQSFLYGIDWVDNQVTSIAYSENIETKERFWDVPARYPEGGSSLFASGLYINHRFHNKTQTGVLNTGIRYAYSNLNTQFTTTGPIEWPSYYSKGIQTNNHALIASVGWRHLLKDKLEYRTLAATSFRAPNIDDFAKIREKNGFITIPNPGLTPEKSTNAELGVSWKNHELFGGLFNLGTTLFYTYLRDAITRQNFLLPNGDDFFVSNGDTLQVQANINSDDVSISGISGHFSWANGRWRFKSNLSYTRGRRVHVGAQVFPKRVPLDHIPPLYGQTSIRYEAGTFNLMLVLRYNGRKQVKDYAINHFEKEGAIWVANRTGTADNIEQAWVNADGTFRGTPAWATINAYGGWAISENWKTTIALENIGDLHYRNFASGISAAGRNISFSLKGMF